MNCKNDCIDGILAVANGPDDFSTEYCSCEKGQMRQRSDSTDEYQAVAPHIFIKK